MESAWGGHQREQSGHPLVDTFVSSCYNNGVLDAALRAIAEPRRREILRLVLDAELPAGQIATHFQVTRPAISQHLGVLKAAGLIVERRQGTRRLYRARPEGLAELREFLERFWGEHLRRLADAAEAEEQRTKERDP